MQFSIVPGAVVPAFLIDDRIEEKTDHFLRKAAFLQEQGGIGQVPLPIVHQGMLPICTGVAAANARSILYYQQTGKIVPFSGLFIYKMGRNYCGGRCLIEYNGMNAVTVCRKCWLLCRSSIRWCFL